MATIIEVAPAPWRLKLVPASFGGIQFHVEQQVRSSGRRVVVHEYPKRDIPYTEDMGAHAIRYQITGYLIGPNYQETKVALVNKLELSTGDTLIDHYGVMRNIVCICERYSVTEVRERGGYCVFEMLFVDVGQPGNNQPQIDTKGSMQSKATAAGTSGAALLNSAGSGQVIIGPISIGGQ